jgi:hypothetical protein
LWTGPQRGISRSLYEGSSGNIQWDLLKDRAEVVLNDGLFGGFKGSGYTERLRMRIAPWRLPIRALHWGRFHGQLTTVVWIRWEGPAPLTLILVNGVEQADGVVEAHGLRVGGRTLAFSESRVLRDGTLRNNLFGRSRWPAWVFPQSGLSVLERKCISHGTLRGEGADETGWVVHELVTWP